MFFLFIGIVIITFGVHQCREPDSDWVRWLSRIPEDVERNRSELFKEQIGGLFGILVGVALSLRGLITFLESYYLSSFIIVLLLGLSIMILGIFLIIRPKVLWNSNIYKDQPISDLELWCLKFGGKIAIVLGMFVMILSSQYLFI